ncbi:unnamed protein product, partial [Plutella xylostella]
FRLKHSLTSITLVVDCSPAVASAERGVGDVRHGGRSGVGDGLEHRRGGGVVSRGGGVVSRGGGVVSRGGGVALSHDGGGVRGVRGSHALSDDGGVGGRGGSVRRVGDGRHGLGHHWGGGVVSYRSSGVVGYWRAVGSVRGVGRD